MTPAQAKVMQDIIQLQRDMADEEAIRKKLNDLYLLGYSNGYASGRQDGYNNKEVAI